MEQSKTCRLCKQVLLMNNFGKTIGYKDGYNTICKTCANKRAAEYRKNNPEKVKALRSKWKKENPEKNRASAKKYQAKNLEKHLKATNEYRQRNRNKYRNYMHNRRVLISAVTYFISDKELKMLYSQPCKKCGSKNNQTIDHIIPIARGGKHSIGNLQTLCLKCNSSKKDKTWREWLK